jgi:septum formation protein
VLASASESRRRLLEQAGLDVEVIPAAIDESPRPHEAIEDRARRLAEEKARAVAATRPAAWVIGGDQVGWIPSLHRELIKCATVEEARDQLAAMGGTDHVFVSVAAIVHGDALIGLVEERATVTFMPLAPADVDTYLATEEWRGTCGAYRFEGAGRALVASTEGPSTAVLGFPLTAVLQLL